MKVVQVTWVDATSISEDMSEGKLKNQRIPVMMTFGTLIVDDEDRIIIASTYLIEDGEVVYRDSLILPRAYIVQIQELR